jgi:hypothetical protein
MLDKLVLQFDVANGFSMKIEYIFLKVISFLLGKG